MVGLSAGLPGRSLEEVVRGSCRSAGRPGRGARDRRALRHEHRDLGSERRAIDNENPPDSTIRSTSDVAAKTSATAF